MDIYKDISNTQNQTFKKLLIDNFSKIGFGIPYLFHSWFSYPIVSCDLMFNNHEQ